MFEQLPAEKGRLIQPYLKDKESVKVMANKRKNLQSILLKDLKERRKIHYKVNLPSKDLLRKIKDIPLEDYVHKQKVQYTQIKPPKMLETAVNPIKEISTTVETSDIHY